MRALVLCSDGLTELCAGQARQEMAEEWAGVLWTALQGKGGLARNLALALLRHVLGGDNTVTVSQFLTLDEECPWIDDTSCVVQIL
jgi:pyruvate dehydrogenase phosphatase